MNRIWVWLRSLRFRVLHGPTDQSDARDFYLVLATCVVLLYWLLTRELTDSEPASTFDPARHRCLVPLHSLTLTASDTLVAVSLFPECLAVVQGRMTWPEAGAAR